MYNILDYNSQKLLIYNQSINRWPGCPEVELLSSTLIKFFESFVKKLLPSLKAGELLLVSRIKRN